MKDGDSTLMFLGVAVFVTATWFHGQNNELQAALSQCRNDFQSFKDGVLYGR
ncbi:hypothetical protein H6G81_35030 [Scytonema hofmannii FACHB-248]|uniref:Uncharacterized protein n=1 Tax=Scytonema hofmannii FACHB-248 TaxID=1842502 RepID=A0ABR8H173_9CYAN|nr:MULTISPECIES: hypothetical protein [Nostocales]MBD2609566.1 hypothetical protein [Scytonema hofmannii FACHB-248]